MSTRRTAGTLIELQERLPHEQLDLLDEEITGENGGRQDDERDLCGQPGRPAIMLYDHAFLPTALGHHSYIRYVLLTRRRAALPVDDDVLDCATSDCTLR